jgi:hypothetical protein
LFLLLDHLLFVDSHRRPCQIMRQTFRRFCQWWRPSDDIELTTALFLSLVSFLIAPFLGAFYSGVLMDNEVLKEHPIHQVVPDMDSFMQDIKQNTSGYQLLRDHPWLFHVELLIAERCSVVPKNLRYLRYTGFVFAGYNTVLMHFILRETFPASAVAWVPIITSLVASCIDRTQIVLLGLFQMSQVIVWLTILMIFSFHTSERIQMFSRRNFVGG